MLPGDETRAAPLPMQTGRLADQEDPMWNKLLRVATMGALALSTAAPAFALCNPGTPHCVTSGGPGSQLNKLKGQLFNPGTLGNCDYNTTLCGGDIAGSSVAKGGTTPAPTAGGTSLR
jgi:hypothetical protein